MNLYEEGFTQNREISWLMYNDRVLDEALDETVPLFERLNYISIFVTNLEEFMQVRVGRLIGDVRDGDEDRDIRSGMTPQEQLDAIFTLLPLLMEKKDKTFNIVDYKLAQKGMHRLDIRELTATERQRARVFFRQNIRDRIIATVIKPGDALPYIDEKRPYIICGLGSEIDEFYGLIDIPSDIPKIFIFENGMVKGREMRYMLVEDIIKMCAGWMFEPFKLREAFTFDIARNADVQLGEGSDDMMEEMKEVIRKRLVAPADKLIVEYAISDSTLAFMTRAFGLHKEQVLFTNRIAFDYVRELADHIPYWLLDELCFRPFKPFNQLLLGHGPVIDRVKRGEMLSCYPYESMDPLLALLRESATDKRVVEIRMTIYRLASQPEIIKYLINAAGNGKTVKVLMEVRARFDEARNIDWAEKLGASGVQVYLGDEKYKVHSKLCQLVLNDEGQTKYVTQLGTGNYNEKSARLYTDLSLITYDQRIGIDANEIFERILVDRWMPAKYGKKSGKKGKKKHFDWDPRTRGEITIGNRMFYKVNEYAELTGEPAPDCFLNYLLASPVNMHSTLVELIRREAHKGENGRILIKCNSISDEKLIEELMLASCMGCRIILIVRGICCLLPGVEYCTENIQVVNVIGRFLEHSRVYIFGEGQDEEMYISSADLMPRNMFKRVEVACPIYGKDTREKIRHIVYLNCIDNVKGRILCSDGSYSRKRITGQRIDSQDILLKESQI